MSNEQLCAWFHWMFPEATPEQFEEFKVITLRLRNFVLKRWGNQLNRNDNDAEATSLAIEGAIHAFCNVMPSGTPPTGRSLATTAGRNYIISLFRRRGNQVLVSIPQSHGDGTPVPGVDPVAQAVGNEVVTYVQQLLDALTEKERQLIRLRIFDGLSFVAIAQQLRLPYPIVRCRYYAALESLRTLAHG